MDLKRNWKKIRLKAYEITHSEVGDLYFDTSKEFREQLKLNEAKLIKQQYENFKSSL